MDVATVGTRLDIVVESRGPVVLAGHKF